MAIKARDWAVMVNLSPHRGISMAALSTATGIPPAKADVRRAYLLADDHVREARGLPPRPIRSRASGKAGGQAALEAAGQRVIPNGRRARERQTASRYHKANAILRALGYERGGSGLWSRSTPGHAGLYVRRVLAGSIG